jgi:hypothetical protein
LDARADTVDAEKSGMGKLGMANEIKEDVGVEQVASEIDWIGW